MPPKNVNTQYLLGISMTTSIGFVLLGYGFAYYNAFTNIMHKQYIDRGQFVISDKTIFNSLISGLIPFGAIFGSILVNFGVDKGRRLTIMAISVVFTVATGVTLVFDLYALIFGRLIMGMCIGAYATVCPLLISEIAPPQFSGLLGGLSQMGAVTGVFIGFSVPLIMPLPSNVDTVNSNIWRYIFALPMIFSIAQFLLFLFFFKYDSPLFYQKKQDLKNYEEVMRKIYYKYTPSDLNSSNSDIELHEISKDQKLIQKPDLPIQKNLPSPSTKPSGYKKALLIGCTLSCMHQFTGINCVTFFSTQIFTSGQVGPTADIHARIGTLLVGLSMFLGGLAAFPLQSRIGRVTFIQISEVTMCLCLGLSGLCAVFEWNIGVIVLTLVFSFAFNFGIGTALWIYCSEILDSYGCSMVALLNMTFVWLFGTFTNLAFECFTAKGVYFGLAAIQVGTMAFVWTYVKETKGKTKQECEHLYDNEETIEE